MRKYTTILWDLDQTILDFDKSMDYALRTSFARLGLDITDEIVARYAEINDSYWKRLELGEITKAEVLAGRFRTLFEELHITRYQVQDIAGIYQEALGSVAFFMDDSDTVVRRLKEAGYRQYVLTNGVNATQSNKMRISGLDQLMDGVFVSELIGYPKPMKEYYDACFAGLAGISREECLVVGDSLTSDMKGANNAQIAACWYNPRGAERRGDVAVDYEIRHLKEIYALLGLE
ncbi:MAG: YjjG family noncanonical pyrimidine nucleotidase [Lachnospiraceae bacterium]|nr:YjjG family noncanonical pyrimidine nucleotidase [Lachnospiraceae bacterium]